MFFRFFIVALLLISNAEAVYAAAAPVRIAAFDFAPYVLPEPQEGRAGLFVDFGEEIGRRAGVDVVQEIVPISRVMKNLIHGLSDCAIFLLSPWSEERFVPVGPVLDRFESVIVSRKGLRLRRVEDLHGSLLAQPRGSYQGFPISEDPGIRRHLTNGYEQSARLLEAGRVDAIVGTALSIFHYLSDLGMDREDIGDILVFDSKPVWLQCAREVLPEEVLDRLRRATNSLKSEGFFSMLEESYTPPGFMNKQK